MKKFKYTDCKVDLRGLPSKFAEAAIGEHGSSVGSHNCQGLTRRWEHQQPAHTWDFESVGLKEVTLADFFELAVRTIQIDGKTIELSEESYQELKKQLVDS